MPFITQQLLRKRAEHNEGMISTLEEITLHQEELENINDALGMYCRKIKILYLQNNIIPKIENLHHLKDLEYLNMALNNVQKIEGLHNCEFLNKLDLTINFIDFDELKDSIEHLVSRKMLKDLYLMGNPAQTNWPDFNMYVIAKLPQLTTLDGTEVTRSMQIKARQMLPKLEAELVTLAAKTRIVKQEKKLSEPPIIAAPVVETEAEAEVDDANEMTENTPEARIKIYQELAQQKKEKEDRANVNAPKQRDYEKEQVQSVAQIRQKEAEMEPNEEVKQRNEGGWDFFWDEESRPGCVLLDVHVARHLDSSLIDVDVHPHYISVVVKSKILRLRLPAEVKVSESKCQRSKVTGSLMIIMPKVNAKENAITIRGDIKAKAALGGDSASASINGDRLSRPAPPMKTVSAIRPRKLTLQEQMLQDAQDTAEAHSELPKTSLLDRDIAAHRKTALQNVDLSNIVRQKPAISSEADLFELESAFHTSNRVTELD